MTGFIALVRAEWALLLRDKTTVTLTFLLPIVFILLFGSIMGGSYAPRLGVVAAPDDALTAVISATSNLRVVPYPDRQALAAAITAHRVDFGLVAGAGRISFVYDPGRVEDNYAFSQIARGITARYNLFHQGVSQIVKAKEVTVGNTSGNWSNLVIPGIIAFSILSAGLLAISGHLTMMKERRQLDRLLVTPMRPTALLGAIGVVRLGVGYASSLLMLVIAVAILRMHFSINWWYYTAFVVAGMIGSMGLGTVIALLVRNPASAGNVANIIAIVMMFFSGIYFPVEVMPSYLRAFSKVLPLTYMADGMRYVTGMTDMSGVRFWTITAALFAGGVILLPLLASYAVRPERR